MRSIAVAVDALNRARAWYSDCLNTKNEIVQIQRVGKVEVFRKDFACPWNVCLFFSWSTTQKQCLGTINFARFVLTSADLNDAWHQHRCAVATPPIVPVHALSALPSSCIPPASGTFCYAVVDAGDCNSLTRRSPRRATPRRRFSRITGTKGAAPWTWVREWSS